ADGAEHPESSRSRSSRRRAHAPRGHDPRDRSKVRPRAGGSQSRSRSDRHVDVTRIALCALTLAWLSVRPASALVQAPDPHAAQPERPTVATHAGTVAPGWIEIEF